MLKGRTIKEYNRFVYKMHDKVYSRMGYRDMNIVWMDVLIIT